MKPRTHAAILTAQAGTVILGFFAILALAVSPLACHRHQRVGARHGEEPPTAVPHGAVSIGRASGADGGSTAPAGENDVPPAPAEREAHLPATAAELPEQVRLRWKQRPCTRGVEVEVIGYCFEQVVLHESGVACPYWLDAKGRCLRPMIALGMVDAPSGAHLKAR
jgi:hypothetical protein